MPEESTCELSIVPSSRPFIDLLCWWAVGKRLWGRGCRPAELLQRGNHSELGGSHPEGVVAARDRARVDDIRCGRRAAGGGRADRTQQRGASQAADLP